MGWENVEVERDFDDGGNRDAENEDKPAESFIFCSDLVNNTPEFMTYPHAIWQETN